MYNINGGLLQENGWWENMATCVVWMEHMAHEHANTYKGKFTLWHANRCGFQEIARKSILRARKKGIVKRQRV